MNMHQKIVSLIQAFSRPSSCKRVGRQGEVVQCGFRFKRRQRELAQGPAAGKALAHVRLSGSPASGRGACNGREDAPASCAQPGRGAARQAGRLPLTGRKRKPMSPRGTSCGWCMRCASCVKMPCTYWKMAPNSTCFQRAMSSGSCRMQGDDGAAGGRRQRRVGNGGGGWEGPAPSTATPGSAVQEATHRPCSAPQPLPTAAARHRRLSWRRCTAPLWIRRAHLDGKLHPDAPPYLEYTVLGARAAGAALAQHHNFSKSCRPSCAGERPVQHLSKLWLQSRARPRGWQQLKGVDAPRVAVLASQR